MNNIRTQRRALNMTMKELAAIVGVTEAAISHYETGRREPDPNMLGRIANALHVTVDYLLGRDDPNPQAQEKAPAAGDEQTIEFNHLWKDMDQKEKAFIISMMKTMKQRAK